LSGAVDWGAPRAEDTPSTWSRAMTVEMELSRILICETLDLQVIELTEIDGARRFPILIGLPEAEAIRRRWIEAAPIKRPLTHELLESVIESFGGSLESISINDLSDHTFYATLNIRRGDGSMLEVDARPSDAIALSVASSAPILVAEEVLEEAMRDA
jgi:bifunctional DNase/RNase